MVIGINREGFGVKPKTKFFNGVEHLYQTDKHQQE